MPSIVLISFLTINTIVFYLLDSEFDDISSTIPSKNLLLVVPKLVLKNHNMNTKLSKSKFTVIFGEKFDMVLSTKLLFVTPKSVLGTCKEDKIPEDTVCSTLSKDTVLTFNKCNLTKKKK